MGYRELVSRIEALGVMPERPPSLEPMQEILRRLGRDFPAERVVIVAGTNGKGSTCATLEALLLSAGQRVGLYTSPHLVDTAERIRVDGRNISHERFCERHAELQGFCADLRLTHFETLTAMAYLHFLHERCDWILLEVGLGGTWDATNAIPHRFCALTRLGLDHQNLLGPTIVDIARNKFGVIAPGSIVVHSKLPEETLPFFGETLEKTRSRAFPSASFTLETERVDREPSYQLSTRWGKAPFALAGRRGAENTALALELFEKLGFSPAGHLDALAKVRWPGRMQRLASRPCPVYFSGDHNPQGVASLVELLKDFRRERLHLVVGIGKEKSADEMLELFSGIPGNSIYLTTPPFKGRSKTEYGAWAGKTRGYWEEPKEALNQALLNAGAEDLILITGSLYLYSSVADDVAGDLALVPPGDRRLEDQAAKLPAFIDDGDARSVLQ